jgi:glucose/arabinose dehydrogenase
MAVRTGDDRVFVAGQGGVVWALTPGATGSVPVVLDISNLVRAGGEQGLLGMAFAPGGRFLYLDYTDTNGDTNVDEFAVRGRTIVAGSRRRVLFVSQPFSNHNGGNLAFGPDGYLYIALGDGGSEGDPQGNGQKLSTLLAKLLRIDPRPHDDRPYGIPPDNPFVDRGGARPEIWDFGLRNPWRFSFDRSTGDLWIGDVGQNEWEEVDVEPAGSRGGVNYGWSWFEGDHPYHSSSAHGTPPAKAAKPVFEYDHSGGRCAVTGGYVYRGADIPAVERAYLYADFCDGEIHALRVAGERVVDQADLHLNVPELASFGQDADGELYALSLGGLVYRLVPR